MAHHLVDGVVHPDDFTDGQIQTIVHIKEDHDDPVFTFRKWQFSVTPGVLNVFTRAPIATTK